MANKSRATANLVSNTGISTFTDLNITRVNITGVGTITNGSITNLTGTAATITTGNFTTGNIVTGVTTNFTSTNGSITNLTGTAATITTGNFTTGNIVTGVTTNFTSTNVVITGVTTVSAGTAALPSISPSGDPNTGVFFPAADHLNFSTGGTSRVQIDSDGDINIDGGTVFVDAVNNRFGIGTTIPRNVLDVNGSIFVSGGNQIQITGSGGSTGLQLIGQDSDISLIGTMSAQALVFRANSTERMRIKSDGNILIGKTTAGIGNAGIELDAAAQDAMFTTNQATSVFVNRTSNDGVLIDLQQDSVSEGTISVSGTTVSYNGAHLSRWSQLASGAERTEILRGSVLSNLDEMCEWGEEDNEQLNRMRVSNIEGDKNVSGVFQCWDDDDDTYINDFYCAMTGDFVIRIAEEITIERGDLLMSAGDGTAKPQDDDIIRSKTIAKVTSTNVTCTYDDGSYCVPCVLMAC